MTTKQQIAAIKTKFSTDLPALLTVAGLSDFENYLAKPPNNRDKRQIGVYPVRSINSGYKRTKVFAIDVQLPKIIDFDGEYDSVIMPFIESTVDADLLGVTDIYEIEANYFPIEPASGSTDLLYLLTTSEDLDDCD